MKKRDEPAPPPEAAELALPDWSGMDDSTARVTPEAAFQLCERYRQWWPGLADHWQRERPEKCLVEFVL